jgi:hypothetical protein
MTGYISNHVEFENAGLFATGLGHFSASQLTDLFDINGDGYVDGVERSTLESLNLIQNLEGISPLAAKKFNNDKFLNSSGYHLVDRGIETDKRDFIAILNKHSSGAYEPTDTQGQIPIERRFPVEREQPGGLKMNENLGQDLAERNILEQEELDLKT